MKKYIIGAVAGAIIATTISAYADEGLEKIEAYVRKGLPITLNGSQVTLESPAVMVDGSTYLKLRDVAKLTGLNVNWNEASQTVELSNGTFVQSNSQTQTGVNSQADKISKEEEVSSTERGEIPNDIRIIKVDGKAYMSLRDFGIWIEQYKLAFVFNQKTTLYDLVDRRDGINDVLVVSDIPFIRNPKDDQFHIESSYFGGFKHLYK